MNFRIAKVSALVSICVFLRRAGNRDRAASAALLFSAKICIAVIKLGRIFSEMPKIALLVLFCFPEAFFHFIMLLRVFRSHW